MYTKKAATFLFSLLFLLAVAMFSNTSGKTIPSFTDCTEESRLSTGKVNDGCTNQRFGNPATISHNTTVVQNRGTSTSPPPGLVSRWTGDGNAGDTLGGNNGTLVNGATFTTGVLGQAFAFDGVDDYFQAPTLGLPTGNSDRTMTMWVKIDEAVADESFFGGYGSFGLPTKAYFLGATGPLNRLFFTQWGVGLLGPQLENGRWYHVAVTNIGNQATLYLDGIAGGRVMTIDTSPDSQFCLGKIPGTSGNTRRLKGAVDDVRVYNRALSDTEIQTIINELPNPRTPFDFDGDGKTDISIFRPSVGEWWLLWSSTGGNGAVTFGAATDAIVPGDYTGDGKADIAVWRPSNGNWYVLRSEDFSFFAFPFGTTGDIPAPADYDGDGRADAAVFRPSNATWFINNSGGSGTTISEFGSAGDQPVNADYDGDGKADIAIYRPSVAEWWIQRSTAGLIAFQFGATGDKTVPGDFTGDGKADVAFWRPATGQWYILRSEDHSFFAFPFGANGDVPVPGDYDGDGKFDAAVFRPSNSTWFVQRSTAGTMIQQFGQAGDLPVPNAFVR